MKVRHFILPLLAALMFGAGFSAYAVGRGEGDILLAPPAHWNGVPGSYMWQRLVPARGLTKSVEGKYKVLVILAQYPDVSFFYGRDYFVNMLTSDDYTSFEATGSAKAYLEDQLRAEVEFTISNVVTVNRERAYYGKRTDPIADEHPGTFIAEACIAAAGEIDFSQFDSDGDGYVDNVFVFYSGEDEAQCRGENTEYMWSHSHNLQSSDYGKVLELSGVKINNYACTAELYRKYASASDYTPVMAPIGTFCHEYLHNFGLVDLYDTDYELSGGTAAGVWGVTSLMASGNYNNSGNTPPNLGVVELDALGVRKAVELVPGDYVLYPAGNESYVGYSMKNPANEDECYMFEARSPKGWDEYMGLADTVAVAMAVYHVDRRLDMVSESSAYGQISAADRWKKYNQVNANPDFQCVDLIEADGRSDKNPTAAQLADINTVFFPQYGATALGGDAKIPLSFHDGTKADYALRNIREEDGTIRFTFVNLLSPVPVTPTDPPKDDDMLYIIVLAKDGGELELRASNSVGGVEKWYFNDVAISDPQHFTPASSGVIRLEVLWPDGSVDYIYKKHSK